MLISNENYLIKEIPNLLPGNPERIEWWRKHKRPIFEGLWHSGKWMPPSLYHYVNFWHILLNKQGSKTKTKVLSRPFFRDIEWEKSYYFEEARGFSGFEYDKVETCHRAMSEEFAVITKELYPEFYEANKHLKYTPAREYLRRNHGKDMGKPQYMNQAQNIIDIEARGGGKSYWGSSLIGLNFITDGATDYDEYLVNKQLKTPFSSETLVGAYDSKWSADLLKKVQLGLDNYPGAITMGENNFPSPISVQFKGSWESGKTIISQYKQKIGGRWETKGTYSKIQHRSFKDNHLAGNGTRGNLNFIEEVGFMANLTKSLGALKECTLDGDEKFGVIWCMGTGGDMEGGTTEEAKRVFYNPKAYDCIVFDDTFEQKGDIGLFIPAHMTLNEFRNEEGVLDEAKARRKIEIRREQAAKSEDRRVYIDELQNKPEKPSEAFLTEEGSYFDVIALGEQLRYVESNQQKKEIKGMYGNCIINHHGKAEFVRDVKNKVRPAPFPVQQGKQPDGCVVIWELPEVEEPPYGMYIAGTDPYDQDKAPNTVSMGSTFILKRFTINGVREEKIVAEYTGRPRLANIHHEEVRRLLMLYNARDLYENERNTIKMHFEHKKSLYLLADSPTILKTVDATNVRTVSSARSNKGIHMTDKQKAEMCDYLSIWLDEQTPEGDGKCNMHNVFSIPLLQELIAYNDKGNFDRVIAILLVILLNNQLFQVKVKKKKENKEKDYFLSLIKRQQGNGVFNQSEESLTYLERASATDKKFKLPHLFQ